MQQPSNGRANILHYENLTSHSLFKEPQNQYSSFQNEALKGNVSGNQVTEVFFSPQNVEALHQGIRYSVYVKSNKKHVIDKQSDTELRLVMRSVYYQYSKNQSFDILGQVRVLNEIVLNYCVEKILSEIDMYIFYKNDISKLPEPLPRSMNVSSAGSRTLEVKRF
jgi:hypothetical protein